MSIAEEFADFPSDMIADGLYFGGPSFTGQRGTGGGPATDVTIASLPACDIAFIPAKLEEFKLAFPGVEVFTAPYYGYASLELDIQYGDIYTDGTVAYAVRGTPASEYGFQLIPAERCGVPGAETVVSDPLLDSGGNILLG